jgi:hypothetical protein
MSETNDPPQEPTRLTPEQIKGIGELQIGSGPFADPNNYSIPEEAVKYWTSIPEEQKVFLAVSRRDMDHLFFFFAQQNGAVSMLQGALQAYSHGDLPAADAFFAKSQHFNASAEANFRRFFTAVMSGARTDA